MATKPASVPRPGGKPRLIILDEPTEGTIIKDIPKVIRLLCERGDIVILLCEQYFDFARELAGYASHLLPSGVDSRANKKPTAKRWLDYVNL